MKVGKGRCGNVDDTRVHKGRGSVEETVEKGGELNRDVLQIVLVSVCHCDRSW